VDDDVGAELDRPEKVRRRERVVDDERDAVALRDRGDGGDVQDPVGGVGDRLGEQGAGLRTDRRLPGIRIVDVGDERRVDAEPRDVVAQKAPVPS
jgi:hypothetical protein